MNLYFYPETETVSTERYDNGGEYESFTASEGMTNGFLLFMEYTHYDSFNTGTEINYAVIDLYNDIEDAQKNARLIMEEQDVTNNEGKRAYYPKGWGTSIKRAIVIKINQFESARKWVYE
jgi:hypothetical protein